MLHHQQSQVRLEPGHCLRSQHIVNTLMNIGGTAARLHIVAGQCSNNVKLLIYLAHNGKPRIILGDHAFTASSPICYPTLRTLPTGGVSTVSSKSMLADDHNDDKEPNAEKRSSPSSVQSPALTARRHRFTAAVPAGAAEWITDPVRFLRLALPA